VERLANLVAMLLDAPQPVPLRRILADVPGYPASHESARVQFSRDKAMLAAEGIEVITVGSGADAAYRIDPAGYYLPDLDLDDDEALALNLAAGAVRLEGDDPDEALWKLGAVGAEGPPLVALRSDPALPVLYEAVRRRRLVTFAYAGERRELEPWGMLCRDGYWYVSGHDRVRGALRHFRVDRIDGGLAVGDEHAFTAPASFDAALAVPAEPFAVASGVPVHASVEVGPLMAAKVVAEVGEDRVVERHDDGTVVLSLPVTSVDGLRSWLFGLLDHARLLDPPDLVDDVRAWLSAVAAGGDPA
jgi:proteasome accessory factor B